MEGQEALLGTGAGAGLNFLGLSPGGGARSLGFGWKVGEGLGTGKQYKKARTAPEAGGRAQRATWGQESLRDQKSGDVACT